MKFEGFCGGSATERVGNINRERSINFFACRADSGAPKVEVYNAHTPCFDVFAVLADGPIRALFYQDGRLFAVGGSFFYEVFVGNRYVRYGPAPLVDGRTATISSNGTAGHQLFITSGGHGYIFDLVANTITEIVDPDFIKPCVMGCFVDGYFVSLAAASATPSSTASHAFQLSDLFDGLSWSGLDIYQVSQMSDELIAMHETHRELWFFGSKHTQVWANVGNNTTPFQPIPGALFDIGIVGGYAIAEIDNAPFWIGQNAHGDRMVFRAQGYGGVRVSTSAIEQYLAQAHRIDNACAFAYQQEGHSFVQFYVPDLETSPVYEVAGPPGQQWHERGMWNETLARWEPDLGRCHAFGFGRHLIGSRTGAAIYALDLNRSTDRLVVAP